MFNPCILIPVYNHEHAIGTTLAELLPYGYPILLVDDGCSTPCAQVLEALAARYPAQISLLVLADNQGKGGAVKAGLQQALALGYSHAVQIDADGQHNLEDLPTFIQASITQPQALISGCPRYDDSVPALRYYGRYLTHIWVWINTLSLSIRDTMCGFRVYPVTALVGLIAREPMGNRMEFDTEVMVRWHWQGGRVINIPTRVNYPLDGVSHFDAWRDNVLISKMHARLFFGMLRRSPGLIWRALRG